MGEAQLQQKQNDCFICAYATSEGVPWKIAKRRLRKCLASKKRLGVSSLKVFTKGVAGYRLVTEGEFDTYQKVFNYGTGILCVQFNGGSKGHAVYWDGSKFIDHVEGSPFDNKKEVPDNARIHHALVKKHCSVISRVKSYLYEIPTLVSNWREKHNESNDSKENSCER